MRNPAFNIYENKDADQIRGNREADQRLCFRYIDSTIHLHPKYEIQASSHLVWLYSPVCVGPGWKPRRPVFSQRGSCVNSLNFMTPVILCSWTELRFMSHLFGDSEGRFSQRKARVVLLTGLVSSWNNVLPSLSVDIDNTFKSLCKI